MKYFPPVFPVPTTHGLSKRELAIEREETV